MMSLKPVSLNIRNIVHPIYAGFHGERSFNWVTLKCNHFCTTSEYVQSLLLCAVNCVQNSAQKLLTRTVLSVMNLPKDFDN